MAAVLVAMAAAMPAAGADADASAEKRFEQLELRWMDALSAKDAATLEQMLAREFTIIGAGSTVEEPTSGRKEWLEVGLNRPFPRHQVRVVKAHEVGDTAVVHCVLTGDYPPMPWIPQGGTLRFLVTDTWIRRDGRWQVLARHSSLPRDSAR